MFLYVRHNCAGKSPGWTVSPASLMLAVPEISSIVLSPASKRMPRVNEDGLG